MVIPWYRVGIRRCGAVIRHGIYKALVLSKKVTNGDTKNIYAVDSILHYMMTYASETTKNVKRVQKNMHFGNKLA